MRRTILWAISAAAILLASNPSWPAEHEELRATPGLWKITYRTQINGQPDPIVFKWRCVSEEQMDDPAAVFAKPAAANATCKQTSYKQTSTTVDWRYHCTTMTTILDTQGAIKFDTPLHYTGEIKVNGVAMGYPIENAIAVEGEHHAACTSPED